VAGTFDDCQRLVKQAFSDAHLNIARVPDVANSINIGRLLPQMFYQSPPTASCQWHPCR